MKPLNFLKRLTFAAALCVLAVSVDARETITLQAGWKFAKGNIEDAMQVNFNDDRWQDVMVPHDWAIAGPTEPKGDGNTGKLPWRDQAWYRRILEITPEWSGKTVYLLFDGIMSNPKYILTVNLPENGTMAIIHSILIYQNGYSRVKTYLPFMWITGTTTAAGIREPEFSGKCKWLSRNLCTWAFGEHKLPHPLSKQILQK